MDKEVKSSEDKRSAEDKALDRFADMMISRIEGISADWKKPWFTEGALSWPKNLDGRDYNGMNALMLMMHCENEGYKIPVFLTFDRVNGLNYKGGKKTGSTQAVDKEGNPLPQVSVNRGSKSFPVFLTTFTVVNPDTHEKIKYDDYKHLSNEEKAQYKVFPKLNVFNVFNVDQTNMAEARPELYKKLQEANGVTKPQERAEGEVFSFPAIDHMIEHNEWICPIKPTYGDNAYYSISKQEIVIPEKRQFKSGESFYSNLAHEMAHSTGAENQLNRLKPSSFGSAEYAREELVAELSAALVSQRYGMEKVVKEDSLPYLKNWLDSLKEEPEYIKTTLTDVKKATQMIIDRVEKISLELSEKQGQDQPVEQASDDKEAVAAKDVTQEDGVREQSKYAVFSAGVGRYVSYVANPVVRFGEKDQALLFDSKDAARAVARECKYYLPDERFTIREVKGQELGIDQHQDNRPALAPLKDLGSYHIPQWALNYMVNGEAEGLSDDEVAEVDAFVKEHFPQGYLMEIDWNDTNDFNRYPAFGPRNADALTGRGESPYLATSTVMVQFLDPVQREEQKELQPDRLGAVDEPSKGIWQITVSGEHEERELQQLKDKARRLGGVPSSEDNKFYFLDAESARKFNESGRPDAEHLGKSVPQTTEEATGQKSRLSDLVVELRGESRQPWISGKVDGEPVMAERLSDREFSNYMLKRTSVEDLGMSHFKNYLDQGRDENQSLGLGR